MKIRPGTAADATGIAALHTDSWRAAYSGIMPASYLDGPLLEEHALLWRTRLLDDGPVAGETAGAAHLLVAVDGAMHMSGFAYLVPQEDGRILLDNLHARPGLIGVGVGWHLLRRAFAWAAVEHPGRPVYLEVLKDNVRATAFYSRQGGRPTAERTERFPAGFELAEIEYTWTAADVADFAGDCGP
ncbi:GNAT family N-acetyltransferase [Streptomyces sp. SBC-4]|nr:GNAT family N-acetyltransferase [Streptomyces sp. SBC-4]MDV5143339.1 GNAT family N-acetyltransferase [Streptomyces sp. SBC-4]